MKLTDRLRRDEFRDPERRESSRVPTPTRWATAVSPAPTASPSTVLSPPMGQSNGRIAPVRYADDEPVNDGNTWVDDGQTYPAGPTPPGYTDSIEDRAKLLAAVRARFDGAWQVVAVDDATVTLAILTSPRTVRRLR